jgi:phospholipid/cholesterol/gamma-HCH transport system substrate-binding protein
MQLTFTRREKIVGIFMVVLTAMLLTIVVMLGRGKDWFKTYVIYYTVFQEAYDLSPNAVVKLYKADIGKVKEIMVEENGVKVELAILDDYASRIRADSTAVVASPTFVGSEYVSIKPGGVESPIIPPKGFIPSEKRRSVHDILDEFHVEETAKKLIAAVQDLSEIIAVLKDPEGPFFTALAGLSGTLGYMEMIASDLEKGEGSLGTLLRSEEPLQKLYVEIDKIGKILEEIDRAADKAPGIMDDVEDAIAIVKRTLRNMEEGSYDVPRITRSTRDGVREIRDAVEEIDKVVKSAQKSFLVRPNLPAEPEHEAIDMGLRK